MQVAILVDCDRLAVAGADYCLWLVGQVDADTALLGFDVDKADVVLRQHRVRNAAHLNLDVAIVNLGYYRNVLLVACVNRIWHQLLHL